MKLTLIVNPSASSVSPRSRILIQRALSSHHDLTTVETARRGHATRLARSAADEGAEVIVVLGGDGTQNEAANGLVGTDAALASLPGGSTNVFARTLGFTNDPLKATTELLDALSGDSRKLIGLGKADSRHFLFHVGIGFDAAVVEHVEKRSKWKRYAGHPFFVWSTLITWARYGENKLPRFSLSFVDADTDVPAAPVDGYLAICMNSNPYTFLGNRPFTVAPGLDFANGMAVLTVKSLKLSFLGRMVASALFSKQRIRRNSKADLREEVRTCEVKAYGKVPYQLDGEYLGDVERLTLRHVPNALNVIAPRTTKESTFSS